LSAILRYLRNVRTELIYSLLVSPSRYFSGSDGCKQHMYNFWHGVLAGYFEGVQDMDRKAEVKTNLKLDKTQKIY